MTAPSRPRWREVALPSEHGGWSLTAEPVLLGLLVRWSWPGLALGLAAFGAFLARTPLKLVLVDRWRGRWLERTALVARIAVVECLAIVGLGAVAVAGASGAPFWVPLALAAPLFGLELWFDMRSRGRRLIPELAGAVGMGSVAAAIAIIGGVADELAAGLWVVMAARAMASIPLVRFQIDRLHGREGRRWLSDGAQVVAPGLAALFWAVGWVSGAAVAALVVIGVVGLVAIRLAPRPAVVVGVQQMVIGLALVVVTAAAIGPA